MILQNYKSHTTIYTPFENGNDIILNSETIAIIIRKANIRIFL